MEFETAASIVAADLPWWARWAPFIDGPIFAIVTLVALAIGLTIAGRELRALPKDAHWTEVARAGVPAQGTLLLTFVILGCFALYGGADALGRWNNVAMISWSFAWIAVGAGGPMSRLDASLGRVRPGLAATVRDWISYFLGMRPAWLALLLSWAASQTFEPLDAVIASAVVVITVTVWGAYVRPSWLAPLGVAAPGDARLEAIAKRVAARVGLPTVPEVWVFRRLVSWPFAYTSPPTLALPAPLLDVMDDEQLEGLCVASGVSIERPAPALTRGGVLTLAMGLAGARDAYGALFDERIATIVQATGALLFVLAMARSMRHTRLHILPRIAELGGRSWARGLERLHELQRLPVVPRLGPAVYDQLVEHGVTPSYPRPAPPSGAFLVPTLCGLLIAAPLLLALRAGAREAAPFPAGIALGSAEAAAARADEIGTPRSAHDARVSLAEHRVAARFEPRDRVHHLARLVRRYVAVGRCGCASEALDELDARISRGASVEAGDLDGLDEAVETCGD